jgi:hypothetical protein
MAEAVKLQTYIWEEMCSNLGGIPIMTLFTFFLLRLLPLEHRPSVKRFVSLQFFDLIDSWVGLLGRVISSSQGLYLNTGQRKHRINTPNTHALYGIRTNDPGFRASEDITCLRPLGYRGRQLFTWFSSIPPRKFPDRVSIRPATSLQVLSNSLFIGRLTFRRCVPVWPMTAPLRIPQKDNQNRWPYK